MDHGEGPDRLYEHSAAGALDEPAAREAIVVPSSTLGVEWSADALRAVTELSAGYPYFLQTAGKYV